MALLQATLLPHLRLLGVKPDLILVVVVCWGSLRGSRQGALWGLWGGMALDLLGNTPFGLHTTLLIPIGLLGAVGEFYLERTNLLRPLLVVFLGTLAYHGLFFVVLQIMGAMGSWTVLWIEIALPAAILNTVLTPIAYWLLTGLGRWGRSGRVIAWEE